MADPTLGEAVGASVLALFTGIAGTFKALKGKSNGNGHIDRKEWHDLKDRVGAQGYALEITKHQVATIQTTLDRHDTKLDDIRDDLSKIMAAVDRRHD